MTGSLSVFWLGFIGSLLAGLGTALGALGILFVRRPSDRAQDGMLSAAAGIMLAATFFSLLLPALDQADELTTNRYLGPALVGSACLLGRRRIVRDPSRWCRTSISCSARKGRIRRDRSASGCSSSPSRCTTFPKAWRWAWVSRAATSATACALAVGIGLQNIPEGFAVALSLIAIGYSTSQAVLGGDADRAGRAVGGAMGAAAVSLAEPLMPIILGMAAGAMLFVISDEIIPETHRRGYENVATFSLLGGFVVMMFLDTVFALGSLILRECPLRCVPACSRRTGSSSRA